MRCTLDVLLSPRRTGLCSSSVSVCCFRSFVCLSFAESRAPHRLLPFCLLFFAFFVFISWHSGEYAHFSQTRARLCVCVCVCV